MGDSGSGKLFGKDLDYGVIAWTEMQRILTISTLEETKVLVVTKRYSFFFFFFGNQRTGGEMKLIDFILFVCYDVRRISFSIVFH